MTPVQSLSDPHYLSSQYKDATHLNARIRLHQLFSTNKYGWQRWLFDQLKLPAQGHILELGCGAGNLWLENIDRLPAGVDVLLSDLSEGMVRQAQVNLSRRAKLFRFEAIDAQSIPFDDHTLGVVIASHMLYHVPDRAKALAEIRRVLRPSGYFYASTNGRNNLKEMHDMVVRFDPQLAAWGAQPGGSFSLENGAAQLREFFDHVSLDRYSDALVVTDAALLTDYILSGRLELSPDRQIDLAEFVSRALQANDGKIYITKDSGVFEARGA